MPARAFLPLRGILFLVLAIYLVSVPGSNSADLTANTIGLSIFAVILLLSLVTLFNGISAKRSFSALVVPPLLPGQDHNHGIANEKTRIAIRLTPIRILPLFSLDVQIHFRQPIRTTIHRISGMMRSPIVLTEDVTFPHRGLWDIQEITFSFGDLFGLTQFRWIDKQNIIALNIKPPRLPTSPMPVITSSARPGDLTVSLDKRIGDPYDLKQYHPSDGMRKILWKVYARRRELISRHPEASMTPEGIVAVYCLARKHDDTLCNLTLSYLEYLETLNLSVFFQCEGNSQEIAQSSQESENALIESVWRSEDSTNSSIQDEIGTLLTESSLNSEMKKIDRLIVFVSSNRAGSKAGIELLTMIGKTLSLSGIDPVFAILQEKPQESEFIESSLVNNISNPFISVPLKKLFDIAFEAKPKVYEYKEQYYDKFRTLCSQSQWQIIYGTV